MIIACPHCRTRYEVADRAIGDSGRTVQCANCTESWKATRDSAVVEPPAVPPALEAAMDDVLEAGDSARSAAPWLAAAAARGLNPEKPPPKPVKGLSLFARLRTLVGLGGAASDAVPAGRPKKNLPTGFVEQRTKEILDAMPMGRLRRALGYGVAGFSVLLVAGGLFARETLVEFFPDMASFYRTFGFEVNLVGLEFSELRTLRTTQDGHPLLIVEGRIESVSREMNQVPPVRVTLFDSGGAEVYRWTAKVNVPELGPGEFAAFEATLANPPEAVERARLTFVSGTHVSQGATRAGILGSN